MPVERRRMEASVNPFRMNLVAGCTVQVKLRLTDHQEEELRSIINLAIAGQTNINKVNKKGQMVPIQFTKEKMEAIDQAHRRMLKPRTLYISFDVTDTGEWVRFRVEESV